MNHRRPMIARIYLPGFAVLVVAIVAQVALGRLGISAETVAYAVLQWTALGGYLLGIVIVTWTTYELCRWISGHVPVCSVCAGMLGRKRVHQGKSYRRCLGCTKENARRW